MHGAVHCHSCMRRVVSLKSERAPGPHCCLQRPTSAATTTTTTHAYAHTLPCTAAHPLPFCFCSDNEVNQLRAEVHSALDSRNVADEKFQCVVLEEVAGLKVRHMPLAGRGAGQVGGVGYLQPCLPLMLALAMACSSAA